MASHPIYQFYVELDDYKPKIWRRFQVMNNISMAKLGYIIMSLFEMKGNHLFEFDIPFIENYKNIVGKKAELEDNQAMISHLTEKGFKGIKISIDPEDEFELDKYEYYDPSVKLHRVFFMPKDKATFSYDFGDGWQINIVFEGQSENQDIPGSQLPMVADGEGFGIVEDCGGIGGLLEIEKAFKKKSGTKYKELCQWLDCTELNLSSFDIDEMNVRIKKLPRVFADIYEKRLEPTPQSIKLIERKSKPKLSAQEKWNRLNAEQQELVISNVFCGNCSLTTIVDYTLKNDKYGVVLEGKCKKCGGAVARLVEDC